MDRDGTIYSFAGPGSSHIQPNDRYGGIAPGLTNHNALGMEVVAKNDQDVTPAQVASAKAFVAAYYPNTPVYGHGEVNPGHKQASEGMAIVNAVRADRAGAPPTVAYPSGAFLDTGGPAAPAAPPPGRVNLNDPFFRQLEAERPHLASYPGVLSALAEKESSGNPNAGNASGHLGLFQISPATAQDWGLSPADRTDPVKSAIATADALEQRASRVGIVRAVGMHYGGPGTPFDQPVGAAGFSPAEYASDVFARAPKYAGAPGEVGYPPPAPVPVDYRGLPFRTAAPNLTPAALGLPPPLTLFPAPAGAAPALGPLVEPESKVPLDKITVQDQSGRAQTYAVPSQPSPRQAANMKLAGFDDFRQASPEQIQDWQQREDADAAKKQQIDADVARARGATPADLRKAQTMYNNYSTAVTKLVTDFPNPEDRAKYIGWINQFARDKWSTLVRQDPQFELFLTDTRPFQYRKPEDIAGAIDQQEQQDLFNMLPTGKEPNAISFEQHLQQFNDHANFQLGLLNAQQQMAPNEMNIDWWNAVRQYRRDQLTADKQQAADLLATERQQPGGGSIAGTAVGAALSAPAAAPPAGAPLLVLPSGASAAAPPPPTAPPPFSVLGHWQE
jgi:hypothetical protein